MCTMSDNPHVLMEPLAIRKPAHLAAVGGRNAGEEMMGAAAGIFRQSVCAPQAKQEDPGVFNDRFARSRSLLYFTASRILGCPGDAELAVRNCWRRASRNPTRFTRDGEFRSWLVRLLIDEALAILHRAGSTGPRFSRSLPARTPILNSKPIRL
jgi:hypothetical protein